MTAMAPLTHTSLALTAVSAAACCRADNVSDNEVWALIRANRDNATALRTIDAAPWVSAAEFRGTMAILQTSVLTLFACIYTALHLNVPAKTDFLSLLVMKTKWVLMALFAPEIVLYMAADQFFQALRLKKQLKWLQNKSNNVDKDFDFDLRYAFFVVMGGVRIVPAEVEKFLEPEERKRFAGSPRHLTPNGVIDLASRGFWIYIRRERIKAKSKANMLQKALVLLQVSYAATTCAARRVYGLPLTLLEVHTMVHVICAVMLYALWFEKPLDVSEAELVYDKDWDSTVGTMIQWQLYADESCEIVILKVSPLPQEAVRDTDPADQSPSFPALRGGIRFRHWSFTQENPKPVSSQAAQVVARWKAVASELDNPNVRIPPRFPKTFAKNSSLGPNFDGFTKSPVGFTTRLTRALEKLLYYPGRRLSEPGNFHLAHSNAFVNIHSALELFREDGWLMVLAIALPSIYGGVHLSAWHFEFPTVVEHSLWNIMCFVIIGAVPTMVVTAFIIPPLVYGLLLGACAICLGVDNDSLLKGNNIKISEDLWRDWNYKIVGGIVLPCYCAARLYIVLESFISLRRVPIGVYYTPPWLQMIPHA